MITPQTNYDVTKERPNKRAANKYIFQDVSNHFNHMGTCFPSVTAGDIQQLAQMGVLNNTTSLVAFENGSYLCNSNRKNDKNDKPKKPENWKTIVRDAITKKLCEVLNIKDNKQIKNHKQIEVITNDDKLVVLSNVYNKALDFGFYDFCHATSCFEKWLIENHLNAYKIGADLCFTVVVGGKGKYRGISPFIQNAPEANFQISHFGYDKAESDAIAEKTISYLSRWLDFKRVAIYKDKDENGYGDPMCCFHCVLKKHYDKVSDSAFVAESSQPPAKDFEFFAMFEDKLKPIIENYYGNNIIVEKHYKKSELYDHVCKSIPQIAEFPTAQNFKTRWLFEIVEKMYGKEFRRVSSDSTYYYFEKNDDNDDNDNDVMPIEPIEQTEPAIAKEQTTKTEVDKCSNLINYFESGYDCGKRTFDFKEFEGKVGVEDFLDCIKVVFGKRKLSMKIILEEENAAEN